MRNEFEKRYNTYATIYCENVEAVQEIKKMYIDKGYAVCQAGSTITTGTHGDIWCKQLDIMTEFTEEQYKVSDAEDEAFKKELDRIYEERLLAKKIEKKSVIIDNPANDEYYKLTEESNKILVDNTVRLKYTSKQAVDYMRTKPVKSVEFHNTENEDVQIFLCYDGNIGIGIIGDGGVSNFNRNDYMEDLWYRVEK